MLQDRPTMDDEEEDEGENVVHESQPETFSAHATSSRGQDEGENVVHESQPETFSAHATSSHGQDVQCKEEDEEDEPEVALPIHAGPIPPRAHTSHELYRHYTVDPKMRDEITRFTEEKKKMTMSAEDEHEWRESIKRQLEEELNRRVREALETPPVGDIGTVRCGRKCGQDKDNLDLERLNSHIHLELNDKERQYLKNKKWKVLDGNKGLKYSRSNPHEYESDLLSSEYPLTHGLARSHLTEPLWGLASLSGYKTQGRYAEIAAKVKSSFGSLSSSEKHEFYYSFTNQAYQETVKNGRLPDGSDVTFLADGKFVDKYGIVRDQHGPFWPADYGPLFPAPEHKREIPTRHELITSAEDSQKSVDNQDNLYDGKWRGTHIVYDSERSSKDYCPPTVSEKLCQSLKFESRFESGNLRQARRVGQFEYELILKTDLYTGRHTQWYYFRVQNAIPDITYKFKIINLLKRDSLYNHGMRPLLYSEKNAQMKNQGWIRAGHHICYAKNTTSLQCPILPRDRTFYTMEWQMEFPHYSDTYYLAHCYPYTFTDLKNDLDALLGDPARSPVMKREVMCETRAGNSCFLLTVTNFEVDSKQKKGVAVSARVHPGETNSSWMMKGLLDYITGPSPTAKELRKKFIFKIVPMLNPDGVIVGNYRCSLAARDLNRNYRHPRRESFPTIWHTKAMLEDFGRANDVIVYCDLHGHSRKQNVFMYGCNSADDKTNFQDGAGLTESFLQNRLFPWLMAQKAPDKFWFRGCKFQINRCKESTGRVVMYRQMNIHNSFTMEATFCGTTICRGERRHFNTRDLQEMGKTFCEVVLDYCKVQENKAWQSEMMLDMTRAITQQILESHGLLPRNIPDFTTEKGQHQLREYNKDGTLSTSEQIAAALLQLTKQDQDTTKTDQSANADQGLLAGGSKVSVLQLLDNMSSRTIDGCVQILDKLGAKEILQESDSSESDSGSEPEMKGGTEQRVRRRRKKAKKSKSQQSENSKDVNDRRKLSSGRPNSASALPAINLGDAESQQKRRQQGMGRYMKGLTKSYPVFVNKYAGRSNGGIPCFSEERLTERATKRLMEMKKKDEEQDRREVTFYNGGNEDGYQAGHPGPLQRMGTHIDIKQEFHDAFQNSPSGNIKTSYMHAHREGTEVQETTSGNQTWSFPDQTCIDSDTESETEDYGCPMPNPAVHSPYQHVGHSLQPFYLSTLPMRTSRYRQFLLPTIHLPTLPQRMRSTGSYNSSSKQKEIVYKLPTMRSKPSNSDSSIPQRHSVPDMVITAAPSKTGNDCMYSLNVSGTFARSKTTLRPQHQYQASTQSAPEPERSRFIPGLINREYTDMVMQKIRGHKARDATSIGFQHSAKKDTKPGTCQ